MLSIINLAATCQMYESADLKNDKATGVCYNNIANLHLKSGKYKSSVLSFRAAIDKAAAQLKRVSDKKEILYYTRVLANRIYQMTMAQYKALRFGVSQRRGLPLAEDQD